MTTHPVSVCAGGDTVSVIRRVRTGVSLAAADWVRTLLERKPARVVTVAMANKTARIVWAVMTRGDVYRPPIAV